MKNYRVMPYKRCKGLRWRRWRYWRKHHRPYALSYYNKICNMHFTDKNKIRFIQQFFRWFTKNPEGFKIESNLKEVYSSNDSTYTINECDFIRISCRTYKAAWKKLLSKLNYEIIDYDILRRHKYGLYFTIFFSDLKKKNKEIMLDITCNKYYCYKIFIVLDGTYIESFNEILENAKLWQI